jgi:ketosteroid isomerase-like protein
VVCAFVAGACNRPTGRDVASDRQLLAKSLREHVDAVNASDVDAILAGMTDDVVYLPPGAPLVQGKDALRKALEPAYKLIDAEVSMRPVETVVADDWAWEWGHLSGTTRLLAGGSPTRLDGKYFYVYKRQPDGSWKIARDIYNENAPPALAALRE